MRLVEVLPCDQLVSVTVHRPGTQTSGSGGIPAETTTKVNTGVIMHVEKLSGGQAHRAFGDQSQARWRGTADDDADIAVNDLIVMDTGPYATTVLQVDDIRIPGDMFKVLELADTDKVPD